MVLQPGKDFHNIDYVVRVVDYEFSLQNRTAEFNLPAATISFNKEDGSEGTIRTNALTLKVSVIGIFAFFFFFF